LKVAAVLVSLALTAAGELRAQGLAGPLSSEFVAPDGSVLRLVTSNDFCAIEQSLQGGQTRRLMLDLRPPCYLPIWRNAPPRNVAGTSRPLGATGDIAVWQYGKNNTTVVAVIGDPVPERMCPDGSCRAPLRQNFRCGGSLQAGLLRGRQLARSAKRGPGVFCVETGLDEKEFWLLAHPRRPAD
jgi:hypothetical protein